ncbi:MAG: YqgE/AlgH family protein [Prolixibacteraceae bacterium]|jgi:putative transcriptional regulator|nr:YqgE/AlgH family protein [Prolixibacteraceae bacterium]
MKINPDLFKIKSNNVAPQKGRILIAEPFLPGSYFNRSIIFLVEHNAQGTVGFVLNKKVNFEIEGFSEEFPKYKGDLCLGGPVNIESLYYIHSLGSQIPNSIHITENLYWGGNIDILRQMVDSGVADEKNVRFFLGYSGWDKGQLTDELTDDSWLVSDISPTMVLDTSPQLWKRMVRKQGGRYILWENFPENPGMN